MEVSSLLFGYSKALYSNWMLYKPDHLLVDCGEGAASTLGNGNFAVEKILLTHGHIDHIAGLPPLLWSRAAGMGDTQKPLTIYHPEGDSFVAQMREYIERSFVDLPYELRWEPSQAGAEWELRSGRKVQTFETKHIPRRLTLGYRIVEDRRRLRTEYSELAQADIAKIAQSRGKDAVGEMMETYSATLVAFGGDSLPLRVEDVKNAELLVHESTLLDARDRKGARHSTLDEAVGVATEANVKTLLINHISGRYNRAQVEDAARRAIEKHGFANPVWFLFHNRLWPLSVKKER